MYLLPIIVQSCLMFNFTQNLFVDQFSVFYADADADADVYVDGSCHFPCTNFGPRKEQLSRSAVRQ